MLTKPGRVQLPPVRPLWAPRPGTPQLPCAAVDAGACGLGSQLTAIVSDARQVCLKYERTRRRSIDLGQQADFCIDRLTALHKAARRAVLPPLPEERPQSSPDPKPKRPPRRRRRSLAELGELEASNHNADAAQTTILEADRQPARRCSFHVARKLQKMVQTQ